MVKPCAQSWSKNGDQDTSSPTHLHEPRKNHQHVLLRKQLLQLRRATPQTPRDQTKAQKRNKKHTPQALEPQPLNLITASPPLPALPHPIPASRAPPASLEARQRPRQALRHGLVRGVRHGKSREVPAHAAMPREEALQASRHGERLEAAGDGRGGRREGHLKREGHGWGFF